MERKGPVTAVERIVAELRRRGLDVHSVRQPIPSTNDPGVVSFGCPDDPDTHVAIKIKVVETFLRLNKALIERIRKAEQELDRERECRKEATSRDGKTEDS